jgi:hypothetical protein
VANALVWWQKHTKIKVYAKNKPYILQSLIAWVNIMKRKVGLTDTP